MRLLTILMLSVFCAIAPAQRGERGERPRERGARVERAERPERPERAERGDRQLPPRIEMRLRMLRARMEHLRERLHELRQNERGGERPRHDRTPEHRRGPQGQRRQDRGDGAGPRGDEPRRPRGRRRGGESTEV